MCHVCVYSHNDLFILLVLLLIHLFFFHFKGCKSGVRSELACADLMAAVRSFPGLSSP